MPSLFGKRGATLMELIMAMVIIAIISGVTAGIIVSLMQLFVYLPKEIKTRDIAHEVMDIMIEGESQRRGMRYAVNVQVASPTQFSYTFGYPSDSDRRNMRFRWDSTGKKIYRSYTAFGVPLGGTPPPYGAEETIPYYARGDVSINGTGSPGSEYVFRYYKADGTQWVSGIDPLTTIRRVDMDLTVTTGTGVFTKWDSSFKTTSSVEIKQYL